GATSVHEQDLAISSLPDRGDASATAPRAERAVLKPAAIGAVIGALAAVAVLVALSRLGQVQLGAPAGSLEAPLAGAEAELATLRDTVGQQQQALFRASLAERRATDAAVPSGEDAVRDAVPVLLALQIVRDRLADGGPFATAVAALRPFARAGRDR